MHDAHPSRVEGAPPPRHVLVTGADGKIGRAVLRELEGAGIDTTGLSPVWGAPSIASRVVTGDATDEADVAEALQGVDAVIHLAAIPHRDLGRPYEVYRTNTDATFNVLAQAGQRGIQRAVIASSINAFGVPLNHHDVRPAYFPIDEEIPERLDDWYSLSKRSDELTAEMAASHWGMAIVAIRFPHTDTWDALREHAVRIAAAPGVQQQVREGWSYLDLRDAARLLLDALTVPVSGATVIGPAARDTLLDADSAELLERYAPEVRLRRPVSGRESLVDTTRTRTVLGFTPRFSIHDPDHAPTTVEVETAGERVR